MQIYGDQNIKPNVSIINTWIVQTDDFILKNETSLHRSPNLQFLLNSSSEHNSVQARISANTIIHKLMWDAVCKRTICKLLYIVK